MATIPTLISELRTLARDVDGANRSAQETPRPQVDGTGTRFRLQHPVLVPGSIWWSDATHYRQTSGVAIDDPHLGMITINPAPSNGFVVDYYFQWFTNDEYLTYLNNASRDLLALSDAAAVPDGLISALLQYALGHFYQARKNQYIHKYASSGGQSGQSVGSVSKGFEDASETAYKRAQTMRDDYYKRLGQRGGPASAAVAFKIDPAAPMR